MNNPSDLVRMCALLPGIRALLPAQIYKNETKLTEALAEVAKTVPNRVARLYDWDFVCDVDDKTLVANQQEYELDADDCRDIINIRYGGASEGPTWTDDELTIVKKRRPEWLDHRLSNHTPDEMEFWCVVERSGNARPVVRLVMPASESGGIIRYRYRRDNIGFGDFPDDFQDVLLYDLARQFVPEYTQQYEEAYSIMVDRYGDDGGDIDPMRLDPTQAQLNRERSGLYGW